MTRTVVRARKSRTPVPTPERTHPNRPAEQPAGFDSEGRWYQIESDAERLERIKANVNYWTDPTNGEEAGLAAGNASYYLSYLSALRERLGDGVGA